MLKNISKVLLIAFPLSLLGAIVKSWALKISNDMTFQEIGIFEGILIGSVTTVTLVGFFVYVHFKLFPVPKDLFVGPMIDKSGPIFGGSPAIFRQGLATTLCFCGAGLGFMISEPLFKEYTLGIGMSLFMPGLVGSILIIELWRRLK